MEPRKRLNKDVLASTALAVLDGDGLDAVTMRRVGQELGVTPMALYRHFRDKEQILDAVAELLLAEVHLPQPDERPWEEQLKDLLLAFSASLRPHASAAGLVATRILASEPGLTLAERTLELLDQAGFEVEQAAEIAGQALCSVVTLVVTEPGRDPQADAEAREDAIRMRKAELEALSRKRYPRIVAAAGALASCASEDVYYARGIELVVAGISGAHTGLERATT
jgi:AcrR family transcriptional regulator